MKNNCLAVIAYKRSENLRLILRIAVEAEVEKIQIFLDAPRTDVDSAQVEACRQVVNEYINRFPDLIELVSRSENLGSAVNVVTALDDMFKIYKHGLILEDDCIPSPQFFSFCEDVFNLLDSSQNVLMGCGSRYFNDGYSKTYLSNYPLIWGWCTTREGWATLRMAYSKTGYKSSRNPSVSRNETTFWRNGRRRSLNGHIDAWDIPLVDFMLSQNFYAVHSPVNLISNAGNDPYALHTEEQSQFCNLPIGEYFGLGTPLRNTMHDDWLRKNLYKIRRWHFISGFLHNLLDLITPKKRTALINKL